MFSFRWVPDERWRGEAAYVTALYANPSAVRPAVSVQAAWNRSGGIIRGLKEQGALIEDHTRDLLDGDGRLCETETRIFGTTDMRAQVWTGQQHVAAYRQANPEERVLAWTGNGNLLQNPHFIAFVGSSKRGILYCLKSEIRHLGRDGRSYSCLVVRKPGYAPSVSIERVRFEDAADGPRVYSERGKDITAEVEYATYGQMLVKNGASITEEDLVRMARYQEFYDLRHLFLFGRLRLAENRWIDAGLGAFWSAEGSLDTSAVEAAIRGGSIVADVGHMATDLVHEGMMRKGYSRAAIPKVSGEYALDNGVLRTVLRPGIYPHSMVGIGTNGALIVATIRGFSNRVGVSIQGAAGIMNKLGAVNALMIDNGGDVMMSFENEMVLTSSDGHRDRLRSILVYRTAKGSTQPDHSEMRLIRYPKQYSVDSCESGLGR